MDDHAPGSPGTQDAAQASAKPRRATLPDYVDRNEAERRRSSRCITGRSADDDSGSVLCQRAGTDLSVLVQTGVFPNTERTAAMVDEVCGQQPDA